LAAAQSNSTAISKKELIEELAAIYKENPAFSGMGSQQSASFFRREPLPTLCSIRADQAELAGTLGNPSRSERATTEIECIVSVLRV
jgi:hypothetical protein